MMISKWKLLSADEQELLENLALADNGMTLRWSDMLHRLIHVGLVSKVSRDADYTYRVAITAKGRALIPAPTDDLARLQAENARLKAALRIIVDLPNYPQDLFGMYEAERYDMGRSDAYEECADIARKALGGE